MGKAATRAYNLKTSAELVDEACCEIEDVAKALSTQPIGQLYQRNVARCLSRRMLALANAIDELLANPESSDSEQEHVIRG